VPTLHSKDLLMTWARRLQEYLRDALQTFAWPESRIILSNGANHNVDLKGGCVVHVTGPTAPFTISGFGGGSTGRQLIIYNASAGIMTLNEQDANSVLGNRIRTHSGNITTVASILVWSTQDKFWIRLTSS